MLIPMKKKLNFGLMVISCLILMSACSQDDSSTPNMSSADQTASIAQSGTWGITYFYDTDKDETANFNGYVFTFNSNGTLNASRSNNQVNGAWSVSNSSSSSNSNGHFNIAFQVSKDSDFDDLNDDWDIISVSDNKIELTDVSGGNGGTDFLTFTKN